MDQLFAPPSEQWQRLSPRYAQLRRTTTLISAAVMSTLVLVPLIIWTPWWVAALTAVVLLAWTAWRFHRQGRLAASWGYAERDDDLYVTHGLWFRNLTIVPYGRMQVVEVSSGPIMRKLDLASVQLVTASASSDATIPGLTSEAAAQLRDRLSERAQVRQAGL